MRISHRDIPDFSSYVNRIKEKGLDEKYAKQLNTYSDFFNKNKSFCHGDASIDNILCRDKTVYYIDPIYLPDVYSSWTLDISKVLTSLRRFDKMDDYNAIKEKYRGIVNELDALEMSHWLRMYNYHSSKEYVMVQIERAYESIRN